MYPRSFLLFSSRRHRQKSLCRTLLLPTLNGSTNFTVVSFLLPLLPSVHQHTFTTSVSSLPNTFRSLSSTAKSFPDVSPNSSSLPCVQPYYYFVTTPIYYVNSSPHIGHLYTSLVADAGARYQALKHDTIVTPSLSSSSSSIPSPVLFSTGTDEHGQKVAEAAAKAKVPVEEFCDRISSEFYKLHHQFSIYPTQFIRTTDRAHYAVVQWLWRKLEKEGYIYLGEHEGWYCQSDEAFLADTQVITRKEYLIEKNLYIPPPTPEEIAKQEKIERNKQRKLQHKLEKKALKEALSSSTNNVSTEPLSITPTIVNTVTSKNSSTLVVVGGFSSIPPTDTPTTVTPAPSPLKTDWTEAELQTKVSSESGHPVERIKETNYLFRLSSFRNELNQLFETPVIRTVTDQQNTYSFEYKFIEPVSRATNIHTYVNSDGFKDLSISRRKDRVPWAIPVPSVSSVISSSSNGNIPTATRYPSEPHSIYVWLDALANYLTVAAKDSTWYIQLQKDIETYRAEGKSFENFPTPELPLNVAWQTLFPHWPADIHIVGKDILKFHAVYWPAFCIGAGLPPPRRILAHGHWTVEKVKMSKSLGNVVVPSSLLQENGGNYTVDSIRYFLLREGRLESDGDYSSQVLSQRCAKECSDTFGNLVNRILNKLFMPAGTPVLDPRRQLQLPWDRLQQYNIQPKDRTVIFRNHPGYSLLPPPVTNDHHHHHQKNNPHFQTLILSDGQYELLAEMNRVHNQILQAYEAFEFNIGLEILTGILQLTNKVYSDSAPWKVKPSNEEAIEWSNAMFNVPSTPSPPSRLLTEDNLKLAGTLYSLLEILRMTGIYLLPIMPTVAPRLLTAMNFSPDLHHPFASWKSLSPGLVYPHEYRINIDQSTILFPKPPSLDNPLGLTRKQAKRLAIAAKGKENKE